MLDAGTSPKRPAPENLRGTVKRRVTGKTGPVELSEKAAAQHWAENVLRWTGKRPTPLEVQQRKLQRVDRSERTETPQPRRSDAMSADDVRMSASCEEKEEVARMSRQRVHPCDEEQEMEEGLGTE